MSSANHQAVRIRRAHRHRPLAPAVTQPTGVAGDVDKLIRQADDRDECISSTATVTQPIDVASVPSPNLVRREATAVDQPEDVA